MKKQRESGSVKYKKISEREDIILVKKSTNHKFKTDPQIKAEIKFLPENKTHWLNGFL